MKSRLFLGVAKIVNYADDFVILCRGKCSASTDPQKEKGRLKTCPTVLRIDCLCLLIYVCMSAKRGFAVRRGHGEGRGMFGLDWLYSSPLMPILAPVLLVIQIGCVIHVLRTGRPYWWLWIIFAIPLIGVAAYIYLEVRPTWGKLDLDSILWKFKSSVQRIAILGERLEDSSTVKNRLALAGELHEAGQFDRECQVLSEGLRGAFKDDVTLLLRLAEAHLEAGRAADAEQIVQQVVPPRSPDVQLQHALLKARTLAHLGQADQAEPLLKELIARNLSEGPRYYYAEFLIRQGRTGEGLPILRDILRQYRRGTVVWRYQEKRWFYAAKRLLKAQR